MKKTAKKITEANFQFAKDYIQKQLDTHSWWPKPQPGLAQHEFKLMQSNPEVLNIWCERWLDSSQLRKLERQVQRPT